MTHLLALILLAAAAPDGQDSPRVAAPPWQVSGVTEPAAIGYTEYFAQKLSGGGIRVITHTEIKSLLGVERQRQLLGCAQDQSECLAEIADALGSAGLLIGTLSKGDSGFLITLRVLDTRSGSELSRASGSTPTEGALLRWLSSAARTVSADIRRSLNLPQVHFVEHEVERHQLRLQTPYFGIEYGYSVLSWLRTGARVSASLATTFPPFEQAVIGFSLQAVARLEAPETDVLAYNLLFALGYGYSAGRHFRQFFGPQLSTGLELRLRQGPLAGLGAWTEVIFSLPVLNARVDSLPESPRSVQLMLGASYALRF